MTQKEEFKIEIRGAQLSDEVRERLNREIRALTIREIAGLDLSGRLRLDVEGLINGIVINIDE